VNQSLTTLQHVALVLDVQVGAEEARAMFDNNLGHLREKLAVN